MTENSYQLSSYDYSLPSECIAQSPLPDRSASRLLVLNGNQPAWVDARFRDVLSLLKPDDCLVFNNTKVIPARLYGMKDTGGKIEILVERILTNHIVLAHIKSNRSLKVGAQCIFADGQLQACVQRKEGGLYELAFDCEDLLQALQQWGHVPLPPYIKRAATDEDTQRYQTVYASEPGAVAAPTAGLHFDESLLSAIRSLGVETAAVTLHVGAGTFQPVKCDDVREHVMHEEWIELADEACERIRRCQARGGRVIAVGTTSARVLESVGRGGSIKPFKGLTNLFIYPGYQPRVVDVLVTNFHLPKSSLLMMVSAFSSLEFMHAAYQHALEKGYRFYSYGDAMWLPVKK